MSSLIQNSKTQKSLARNGYAHLKVVLQKFLSVFIPKLCFLSNKATDAPLDLGFSRVLPPSLRGPWELIFDTLKIRCKFLLGGNDLIDIIQPVHAWFY